MLSILVDGIVSWDFFLCLFEAEFQLSISAESIIIINNRKTFTLDSLKLKRFIFTVSIAIYKYVELVLMEVYRSMDIQYSRQPSKITGSFGWPVYFLIFYELMDFFPASIFHQTNMGIALVMSTFKNVAISEFLKCTYLALTTSYLTLIRFFTHCLSKKWWSGVLRSWIVPADV